MIEITSNLLVWFLIFFLVIIFRISFLRILQFHYHYTQCCKSDKPTAVAQSPAQTFMAQPGLEFKA